MNIFLFFIFSSLVYLLGYIPGRIFVERLNLDIKVKFTISFGVSYFLYFFFTFISYIFNSPFYYSAVMLIVLLSAVGFIISKKHRFRITKEEITLFIVFGGAFLFVLCVQGLLPYYSGATSSWDWYEHYLRSIFFLNHQIPMTVIGSSILPQRMPLFNAAAAFVMSMSGSPFWIYQTISTLFNASIVLPCFLILESLVNTGNKQTTNLLILTSLFLLNPFVIGIMATHTITKSLTAYFVLVGFYFFTDLNKRRQVSALYLAMFFLACGHLTHLMALPYVIIIIFLMFVSSVRSKNLKHFFLSLLIYFCVIGIWYVWSYLTYGRQLTFFEEVNLEWSRNKTFAERIDYFLYNSMYTVLPLISSEYFTWTYNNTNRLVFLFDRSLTFYTTNIPGAMSITISLSLLLYFTLRIYRVIKRKVFRIKVPFDYFAYILFSLAGFIPVAFTSFRQGGVASWIFVPTVFLLFTVGVAAIIVLSKKLGKVFIFYLTVFVLAESLMGIGFKIYVAKYQLDPHINTNINIQRDLYDVPVQYRYSGFAVHLINYMYKTDNHLILLYDKFADLQPVFILIVFCGWVMWLWLLIKSLLDLHKGILA